jgi:hypothetical protein
MQLNAPRPQNLLRATSMSRESQWIQNAALKPAKYQQFAKEHCRMEGAAVYREGSSQIRIRTRTASRIARRGKAEMGEVVIRQFIHSTSQIETILHLILASIL